MISALIALLLAGTPPENVLQVSAVLPQEPLEIGTEGRIVMTVGTAGEWSMPKAGLPGAIVQIDPPPSVQLSGKVLSGRDLTRNEFLQAPYELLVRGGETTVPFVVIQKPGPQQHFGLNILAYVAGRSADEAYFVRQRWQLPLAAGAQATTSDTPDSVWGVDRELVQIGEPAPEFILPRAYGPPIGLGHYLGDKNILVTTYRAFW